MVRIAQIGNSSTISLTVELFPIYAIRTKNGKQFELQKREIVRPLD